MEGRAKKQGYCAHLRAGQWFSGVQQGGSLSVSVSSSCYSVSLSYPCHKCFLSCCLGWGLREGADPLLSVTLMGGVGTTCTEEQIEAQSGEAIGPRSHGL